MFTKRFFLAFALMALSFGNTMNAANSWTSIFSPAALSPEWNFFECTGGGSETFSALGSNASSYAIRTWTGDNGVAWSATDARTDLDLTGKAIGLRTSTLKNTVAVTGGVGTLSFNYQRVFTGNSTLKVFVNGVQYGGDITVSATSTAVYSQIINVEGSVNIEIRNSGNRTIVDDITWTCYSTAGQEPCVAPVVTDATIDVDVDTVTSSSATIVASYSIADAALAIISTSSSLSASPSDAVNYAVGDSIGGGKVVYNGNLTNFNVTGLNENTDYFIYLFPYNSVECTGGPLYFTGTSIENTFSTPVAPCIGGAESFSNLGSVSSAYATRTWTGDNGVTWTATDARTDQNLSNAAIALRNGSLKNTTPASGGISTLSFNYKRVFSGNSTLKVLVNGVQQGGDITVSSDSTSVYSQAVDLAGAVSVEIQNSGNRTIIDDIAWTCFEIPNRPEIQLLDSNLVAKECGTFSIDLGNVAINTNGEATFTIKNSGAQNLNISNISIDNTDDYTIVSPSSPIIINSLGTQDVVVLFNSTSTGIKTGILTIESDDADEGVCDVLFSANVLNTCIVPVVSTGDITVSNQTSESVDVEVEGVTAEAYIALVTTGTTVTAPLNGTVYTEGTTLGSATVGYVGTSATFTIEDLNPATTYNVYVYAYNTAHCIGGPAYSAELQAVATTIAAPCVEGGETFTNIGTASTSYGTRNWTGDNGITWTATDARNDQSLTGKAIALRTGTVKNTSVISGGIGTLSFNYKRVFNGNSTLKVFVNGVQYGTDITVSSETTAAFSQVINVNADANIEIRNSGNRTIIDDIVWSCNSGSANRTALSLDTPKAMETSEITLYPNPNNGQFQLDLATESATVSVYDTLGKQIFNKEVLDNEVINLENAGKGIYMVVIKSGNTVSNKKVIVN